MYDDTLDSEIISQGPRTARYAVHESTHRHSPSADGISDASPYATHPPNTVSPLPSPRPQEFQYRITPDGWKATSVAAWRSADAHSDSRGKVKPKSKSKSKSKARLSTTSPTTPSTTSPTTPFERDTASTNIRDRGRKRKKSFKLRQSANKRKTKTSDNRTERRKKETFQDQELQPQNPGNFKSEINRTRKAERQRYPHSPVDGHTAISISAMYDVHQLIASLSHDPYPRTPTLGRGMQHSSGLGRQGTFPSTATQRRAACLLGGGGMDIHKQKTNRKDSEDPKDREDVQDTGTGMTGSRGRASRLGEGRNRQASRLRRSDRIDFDFEAEDGVGGGYISSRGKRRLDNNHHHHHHHHHDNGPSKTVSSNPRSALHALDATSRRIIPPPTTRRSKDADVDAPPRTADSHSHPHPHPHLQTNPPCKAHTATKQPYATPEDDKQ
ncbi:hypothetical protein ST47_g5336 [Ascochyta rabiei]|uniref:Uncharacterized protein n=1 Tax=Didymella rabiei TaxID=5454 RepID=A0A163E799_DIDRA|nr:hypothetical protein ST47_g5336 [Ascochyta rabiei]